MRGAALLAVATLFARCPSGPETAPAATRTPPAQGSGLSVLLITIDTLRADHLGVYGYGRRTSPHIDALAARGVVFEHAYTYWPKTRGSFVMMMTGRRPSQNGYSKSHPGVVGFNPTIASVLKGAGYHTAASVDNPNVGKLHGFGEGFDAYHETWENAALGTEWERTRAITDDGIRFLSEARADRPSFLWLHYVNPHAPYAPPSPWNTAFEATTKEPALPLVEGFHGGIPRQWAVPGKNRLGEYVALYDGEIAAVDAELGRLLAALEASSLAQRTLVILTSDHGESLGEHDYYFDHGENLFDPCLRIPMIVAPVGGPRGVRSRSLVSTLDVFPTVLDAAQVSYPAGLAGASLLALLRGGVARERLFAENERHLAAGFGPRLKVVATPGDGATRYALYDRITDPGERADLTRQRPDAARVERRELELFLEGTEREWAKLRPQLGEGKGEPAMGSAPCEALRALGYVSRCPV